MSTYSSSPNSPSRPFPASKQEFPLHLNPTANRSQNDKQAHKISNCNHEYGKYDEINQLTSRIFDDTPVLHAFFCYNFAFPLFISSPREPVWTEQTKASFFKYVYNKAQFFYTVLNRIPISPAYFENELGSAHLNICIFSVQSIHPNAAF